MRSCVELCKRQFALEIACIGDGLAMLSIPIEP